MFLPFWGCLAALAAEPMPMPPLDPDAYAAAVLATHPMLRAAEAEAEAADAGVRAATALPDPMLEVELGVPSLAYEVRLRQALPPVGARGAARDKATADADAGEQEAHQIRVALTQEARRTWAELAMLDAEQAVLKHHQELYQTWRLAAEAALSSGSGEAGDALMAQAEQEAMQVELLTLAGERAAALARFNALLGAPTEAAPPALSSLSAWTPHLNPRPADPAPPALAAALARARSADAEVDMALADRRPMVEGMVGHTFEPEDRTDPHMWMVGVGLTLPLRTDARQGRLDAASAMVRAAAADVEATARDLDAARAAADARARAASEALQHLDDVLIPLARQRLDLTEAALASGTGSLTQALLAAQALADAELARIEQAAAIVTAMADLDAASGLPTPLESP